MKTKLTSLAAMLLLAGCALGPTTQAPDVPLPTAWSLAAGDVAPDWAGLLDPTLAALQARALEANRDVALAAQRWKRAQIMAEQSALRWTPNASLSTNASRPLETQSSTRNVDVGGVTIPVNTSTGVTRSYSANVGVGYELDLWNRLAQTQAAQRANAESAMTDIAAARLLIRSQVAEAYWTLASIRARQPLAETQLALTRETLELTRLRVREGKLLPIEVDKIAATVQTAENHLADLAADSLLQRQRLALLLDEPLPGPSPAAALPAGEPPRWRLAEPAEVLAQRPDVQRDRFGVDAALARLRVSEADRYPRLSFNAGVSTGGAQSRDWLSQPLASLGANLVVPMIDWQRLALQRDSARTELDTAALTLRDTLNKALAEIETQRIEAERVAQQLAANASRLREAIENERLATVRYEAGSIARANWLEVRNARLEAEQTRLQLRAQQWVRQAQLFKALGGMI
ncbi:TolC family protein [Roseateles asaccharophilus]|uniref:Outer membrane protein TolC n=1 Tax=Roseateles asaccharophilus TaxID=582607 RepID=A0ABU2A543_9BURK|nr:TolC family protein [Roseateles asaccharophilus]MDR7332314.1 outer membrane protein TolC [Roseateles asaccharophilus]